jgi:general secretion pathway protein G
MANEAIQTGRRLKEGFTLLELVIVIAIMGTLAAIAVPIYGRMLDQARGNIAVNDIKALQQDIDFFQSENGRLPDCLDELPNGNRVDPWGNPYKYLNTLETSEKEKGGGGGSEKEKGGGGSKKDEEGAGQCSSDLAGGGKDKARKDRYMTPLNRDYDLYSMGPDGKTNAPITAKASQDDIIRAGYGGYIGVAANF